jgi:hypothetical protein
MTKRNQKPTVAQSDAPESMSVDEAIARFTGEWVLMQVTRFDEVQIPCEGVILTHSPRREDISSVLARQPHAQSCRLMPGRSTSFERPPVAAQDRSMTGPLLRSSRSSRHSTRQSVPGDAGEITVQLTLDSSGRWHILPVAVGEDVVVEMIPNPGFPRSVISQRVRNDLVARGVVATETRRALTLRDLRIEGYPIPDITVRVAPITRILGVDGILGFDFFENYTGLYFDVRARRLTLIDP